MCVVHASQNSSLAALRKIVETHTTNMQRNELVLDIESDSNPVKKRDHDYITVISQTSHKCEVMIKTSQ